jgi:PleD family two-component response regulator
VGLDGFLDSREEHRQFLAVGRQVTARSDAHERKALQVLLVEDNAGDVRLLREMFSKEKPDSFELTHLLRMSEAEIHLAKGGVDIVLLDMGLPDGMVWIPCGGRTRRPQAFR